ncbi:hypothetical protein TVAG_097640 [Trichomonas vaginalis G3]|uniref:Protein kinase domain-containing protein n=1 Tax=Trichomonas vaginalis (strain ATCC PRA-98 / G3) TaxID=412133 RepID=A2E294_TRIV3|nr:hypothetical protein TVAG_097640 [Trichomonas vaginalis G3]|eukprot:XP_001325417.1 hypothetical protein [Trichomonas vaginalis G3]
MDYIPGITITKLISGGCVGNRIKKLCMLEIFAAIASQLTLMKEMEIKHRDLKPDNIVVDGDMIPHIIDWDDSTDRFSLSISERHGTIPFAAPEIFSAQRKCESDIFSFGAIMFNMITERYPFYSAYRTRAGLQSLADKFSELQLPNLAETLDVLAEFEQMDDSEQYNHWPTVVSYVEPILTELIKAGARDDYIYNERFQNDPFNRKISELIGLCCKQEPDGRITPEDLHDRIDSLAKEILTDPNELDQYNKYGDYLFSLQQQEYGTKEMIDKTKRLGFYENDETLLRIIQAENPRFEAPRSSVFAAFVQSLAPTN